MTAIVSLGGINVYSHKTAGTQIYSQRFIKFFPFIVGPNVSQTFMCWQMNREKGLLNLIPEY